MPANVLYLPPDGPPLSDGASAVDVIGEAWAAEATVGATRGRTGRRRARSRTGSGRRTGAASCGSSPTTRSCGTASTRLKRELRHIPVSMVGGSGTPDAPVPSDPEPDSGGPDLPAGVGPARRPDGARHPGPMSHAATMELRAIGHVASPVTDPAAAAKQGDEGAPEVTLVLDDAVAEGLRGVAAGAEMLLLTWLHHAPRDVLVVRPRGDRTRPETGVFATRSPARPNPIGLHRVHVVAVDGTRLRVRGCEAVDGTPVVDLKPVLAAQPDAR